MGMPDAEGHGPPEGLPDLPPEWGRVVVPDDASTLAEEARQVRRELRRVRRQAIWRRRLGPVGRPSVGLPMLVLLVAVLITLTGLAAVTWPRSSRSGGAPTVLPYPTAPVGPLPALDLVGPDDAPVPLRSLLPAMIVLVDACPCAEQVRTAAAAAPPEVTVVTVTQDRSAGVATAPGVRPLADPAGGLRSYLHLSAHPGTAAALLVDRQGTLVRVVPELGPAADYRDDLARLAG
ncbi:TlpA family protein disulfide reductase [Micromonospora sp. NPDC005299]|uniref:TlpA family protein disulfide reductase n=1 Tax=Micromonospora sp. NPDC005299 TaxID=3364231 RepID=UPI0036C85F0B